ncbi:hypothetical protein Tco_0780875 [Tanacetum coccineum]
MLGNIKNKAQGMGGGNKTTTPVKKPSTGETIKNALGMGGGTTTTAPVKKPSTGETIKNKATKTVKNTLGIGGATSLERYLSDHRPILLRESHFDYGPTPFRFFHSWFEMEDAWNEAPVDESNAMSNMMKKLKYLKQKIRDWNKGNMKSSKNIKAKLKDDLKAVDDIIDNGEGNDEVVKLRMDVLKSIQDIDKIQSLDAAQKAKIKWSIEGDENSSFYHGVLNKKRSQLNIRGILVDGTWVDNPQRVKNEFLHHFSKRFDKPAANRASLVMNFSKILSCDQQVELELEVSKDEVKRAVWDCGTDKAPGPDGFTFGFYRRFWKVIENDVFDAVNHFFTYGDIPKGCNSSFIALIPKIPDANVVKDFRPISLIGSLYKIIAKILANRLVVVLGDIVNEVQSAFIADRQILDGPFILNEVLQWCSKVGGSMHRIQAWNVGWESIRSHFFNAVIIQLARECLGLNEKMCWPSKKKGGGGVLSLPMHRIEVYVQMGVGINLLNCMQMKLGNGDKTAFWEDIWIGHIVLKDLYPRIYALETCKFVKVGHDVDQSRFGLFFLRKQGVVSTSEQYEAFIGSCPRRKPCSCCQDDAFRTGPWRTRESSKDEDDCDVLGYSYGIQSK